MFQCRNGVHDHAARCSRCAEGEHTGDLWKPCKIKLVAPAARPPPPPLRASFTGFPRTKTTLIIAVQPEIKLKKL